MFFHEILFKADLVALCEQVRRFLIEKFILAAHTISIKCVNSSESLVFEGFVGRNGDIVVDIVEGAQIQIFEFKH